MNGGYVMIDLGTFGWQNAVANESAINKIEKNLGIKPLYFKFHRVDYEDDDYVDVGDYVFYGNVFQDGTKYYIPVCSYATSGSNIVVVSIEINKTNKEFVLKEGEASGDE